MFWTERVLSLVIVLSVYAAFFSLFGRWERLVATHISLDRARELTLTFGRIVISVVHFAAVIFGIGCSTVLVIVILTIGYPPLHAFVGALLGSVAFAAQSVTSRIMESESSPE